MTTFSTQSIRPPRSRRGFTSRGFTLVELLVVIAIIGTLTALALFGVQRAREAARRADCLNNMKQIALGITNYDSAKQRYPGYLQSLPRSKQTGAQQYLQLQVNGLSDSQLNGSTVPDDSRISWAAMILNEIEQGAFYDAMVDSTIVTGGPQALIKPIDLYCCPADTELMAVEGNAGLSYSANTGTWDGYTTSNNPVTAPFDRAKFLAIKGDTRANGIFHDLTFGKVKMDSGDVSKGDGLDNTILLAENIQKEDGYTWAGVAPNVPGEQRLGVVWLDPAQYGDATNRDWTPFTSGDMQPFSMEGAAVGYPPGTPQFARPASAHAGVFNVAMASGAARNIANTIDYSVYQRLLTVQGRKCVEPVENKESAFRTLPPLGADDY